MRTAKLFKRALLAAYGCTIAVIIGFSFRYGLRDDKAIAIVAVNLLAVWMLFSIIRAGFKSVRDPQNNDAWFELLAFTALPAILCFIRLGRILMLQLFSTSMIPFACVCLVLAALWVVNLVLYYRRR